RRLRKRIKIEEYTNEFDINKVYQDIIDELNLSSEEYDIATAHGSIEPAQNNWSNKILSDLEELEEYKDTDDSCPCSK
ncbi:MAG TPA: hypothetical protein VGA80_16790, partial [Flavobacteriaceae bacterium]